MNKTLVTFIGCAALLSAGFARADDSWGKPQVPSEHIQPANVPEAAFKTVQGTITVRLDGVLVDAKDVSYIFAPEFPGNTGSLVRKELGTYFLKADNISKNQPYSLTITALYNDSV